MGNMPLFRFCLVSPFLAGRGTPGSYVPRCWISARGCGYMDAPRTTVFVRCYLGRLSPSALFASSSWVPPQVLREGPPVYWGYPRKYRGWSRPPEYWGHPQNQGLGRPLMNPGYPWKGSPPSPPVDFGVPTEASSARLSPGVLEAPGAPRRIRSIHVSIEGWGRARIWSIHVSIEGWGRAEGAYVLSFMHDAARGAFAYECGKRVVIPPRLVHSCIRGTPLPPTRL